MGLFGLRVLFLWSGLMDDFDDFRIKFLSDLDLDKYLDELKLKEGNLYLILKPQGENGFEIIGADKLPKDISSVIGTKMYILFAGLMHLATEQQDLVMEAGNFVISTEMDRKLKEQLKNSGDNIVIFPKGKKDIN